MRFFSNYIGYTQQFKILWWISNKTHRCKAKVLINFYILKVFWILWLENKFYISIRLRTSSNRSNSHNNSSNSNRFFNNQLLLLKIYFNNNSNTNSNSYNNSNSNSSKCNKPIQWLLTIRTLTCRDFKTKLRKVMIKIRMIWKALLRH